MAGYWEFNKADPSSVRIGLTQRDQFNNDIVGLAEALVRESIQNSLDAGTGEGPVKVIFGLKNLKGEMATILEDKFSDLLPHLNECKLELPVSENQPVRVLTIEDFNTHGLTGSFVDLEKGNFCDFWRVVGESKKSGKQGGRWGLGKLVYSSSSQVRSFFGLTLRANDCCPAIMGQAVLANHKIKKDHYLAHGFWFGGRSADELQLQLPVQDKDEFESFRELFDIKRTDQRGLSVIIPYLIDGITERDLVAGVVNNYYFPILAGNLDVEVGKTIIKAENFLQVASNTKEKNTPIPFLFIKEISDVRNSNPVVVALTSIGDCRLSRKNLTSDQISYMKSAFDSGKLVHLRVPVDLRRRDGAFESGKIDLFLKDLSENEKPFSLFARGSIIVPDERHRFRGALALGAMIANDALAAEFLGDAENPAHTAWNIYAEKLNDRWVNAGKTLTAIRHSLKDLYSVVVEQDDERDNDALIDFFSLVEKAQASKGRKRRVIKPQPEIPQREVAIRINKLKGGFELKSGPGAETWSFPKRIRVRMAYDTIGTDPFKRFSPFDFNLSNLNFKITNGDIKIVRPNILIFIVNYPRFDLRADGFDVRRDLVVDARPIQ